MKGIHLGEEMWLQDTVYALPEDMLLYYKLYLDRNRIAINMDVSFFHLDAGATLVNTDKYINNIYAMARNGVISGIVSYTCAVTSGGFRRSASRGGFSAPPFSPC